MKKILLIITCYILFPALLAHSQECNIYMWNSDGSLKKGPVPTEETSRTIIAAGEATNLLLSPGGYTYTSCSAGCCYRKLRSFGGTGSGFENYTGSCIDGTWNSYFYSCLGEDGINISCGYTHNDVGTWDVVCDNTTTTMPQSTTTTSMPSTVIELSSFYVAPKSGKIIVSWNTESETDNAGFNLYRSETENGEYVKIIDSLIPSQGSSTQGSTYEFTDTDVQNRKTYYYKLEDIDLSGQSTLHGPVSGTPRLIYGIGK